MERKEENRARNISRQMYSEERERRGEKIQFNASQKGEQLEGSDTDWNGTARRLLLIVNGRASLLWQLEPKWSLTALSGSLSGSVTGQESG